ncbi:hypothetical protein GCM10009117_22670 [Gangjinia marincola]|uniref:NHL repeat-containing protein n=1 Tax=Gangjinia marincola TaxID=578463 RepID=A0ABP3XXF8_9FLAO
MNVYSKLAKTAILAAGIVAFIGCQEEKVFQPWQPDNVISLDEVSPLGITAVGDDLWVSDSDRNQLVKIDENGKTLATIGGFDRPMHIATDGDHIIVPQYGNDEISRVALTSKQINNVDLAFGNEQQNDSLDAPAGVWKEGNELAIADFYNHRFLYKNAQDQWLIIGQQGKKDGEFYYPTDIQLTTDRIIVADAYNHRVQVFDKQGNHLNTIGVEQNMNAATGIWMAEKELYVTDFENDRVLVFDLDGKVIQEFTGIEKPTDIIIHKAKLYITSYRGGKLHVFKG